MKGTTPFSFSIYIIIIIRTISVTISPTWVAAWIILEVNILTFIPLIKNTKWNQETEAATKYFLAQAIGSLLLLLGSAIQNQIYLSTISSIVLTVALLLKLGAAPCHLWYPSVIRAISWTNCLILSTWQKLAPLALILCLFTSHNPILLIVAGINALLGGIMGINQTHLRQLLAYSSIGHIGWILSIARINIVTPAILYFFMYSILVIPVFLCLNLSDSSTVKDINSTSKLNQIVSPILSILIISLAGLPPLTGFVPKFIVIINILTTNYIIIFILLLGSYINLYYYLNISLSSIFSHINRSTINKSITTSNRIAFLTTISISIIGLIVLF